MSAAPKKATTSKKAPTKKPATKTKSKAASAKKPAAVALQSFRPAKPTEPFFTFRITRQTVYWLILSVIIIGLAAWVLQLSARVQSIYDQIEQNSMTIDELSTQKATVKKSTDTPK